MDNTSKICYNGNTEDGCTPSFYLKQAKMDQKFLQKKVESNLKNFMSSNRDVKNALSLTSRKNTVRDIMVEQKMTKDISKLSGKEQKEFIKAIVGAKGMGYEGRRVFSQAFNPKKPEQTHEIIGRKLLAEHANNNQEMPKVHTTNLSSKAAPQAGANTFGHISNHLYTFGKHADSKTMSMLAKIQNKTDEYNEETGQFKDVA